MSPNPITEPSLYSTTDSSSDTNPSKTYTQARSKSAKPIFAVQRIHNSIFFLFLAVPCTLSPSVLEGVQLAQTSSSVQTFSTLTSPWVLLPTLISWQHPSHQHLLSSLEFLTKALNYCKPERVNRSTHVQLSVLCSKAVYRESTQAFFKE